MEHRSQMMLATMIDAEYGRSLVDYKPEVEELNAKEEKGTETQRREEKFIEDELSYKIIGAAIEVHSILGGPGLLESIYEAALYNELLLQGLRCKRQVPI